MNDYPVYLRLADRPCVVVGAGEAAEPRILELLAAGARLKVVAPRARPRVAELAEAGRVQHLKRAYQRGDLDGCLLAYAAVGDDVMHRQIAEDAANSGVLLNVVDRPRWCDFITPALVRRGRLAVAISTGGASPALARRIREDLEAHFGAEYAVALEILARMRPHLAKRNLSLADKQRLLGRLVAEPFLDFVRSGQTAEIDRLLAAVDPGLSLAALGITELHMATETESNHE